MTQLSSLIFSAASLLLPSALALAQGGAPPGFPTHVNDYSSTYVLAADGSFVETRSLVVTVLTTKAS